MNRAVVSYVSGTFWISAGGSRSRIADELVRSHEALSEWAESEYEEVLYNFPKHLIPEETPPIDKVIEVKDVIGDIVERREVRRLRTFSQQSTLSNMVRRRALVPKEETVECTVCHKPFIFCPSKSRRRKTCSDLCAKSRNQKAPAQLTKLTCKNCGKEFEKKVIPSTLRANKGNFLCQKSCQPGYQKKLEEARKKKEMNKNMYFVYACPPGPMLDALVSYLKQNYPWQFSTEEVSGERVEVLSENTVNLTPLAKAFCEGWNGNQEQVVKNGGISSSWVLCQLAGMEFPGRGEAYDFIKRCLDSQSKGT